MQIRKPAAPPQNHTPKLEARAKRSKALAFTGWFGAAHVGNTAAQAGLDRTSVLTGEISPLEHRVRGVAKMFGAWVGATEAYSLAQALCSLNVARSLEKEATQLDGRDSEAAAARRTQADAARAMAVSQVISVFDVTGINPLLESLGRAKGTRLSGPQDRPQPQGLGPQPPEQQPYWGAPPAQPNPAQPQPPPGIPGSGKDYWDP